MIIKPTKGQIDDLMEQINKRVTKGDRVLVTTLTKKMAEDLTDYLLELGVRVRYLHSEVDTIQRIEILRDLRLGEFDVLVGINLLREGLDLPEVSLVAILDADKEGFLRSETSLIQMIGRAARNVDGQVVMYADRVTDSMQRAISETNRRRGRQEAYNAEHDIDPQTIRKAVTDILASLRGREGTPMPGKDKRSTAARQAAGRPRRTAPRRVAPPDPHAGGGDEPGRHRPQVRVRRSPAGRDQGPETGTSRGRIAVRGQLGRAGGRLIQSETQAAPAGGGRPRDGRGDGARVPPLELLGRRPPLLAQVHVDGLAPPALPRFPLGVPTVHRSARCPLPCDGGERFRDGVRRGFGGRVVRHLAPPRPAPPRPRADRHDLVVRVRHPVVHHRLVPVRRRHGFLRVPRPRCLRRRATG